ncbi:MAG: DUF2147 domain-containing protein [Gammaproteobacteria bacterium]|nr:DUF2147 domain-containing protein [Gammaproteobacteria bacterium]
MIARILLTLAFISASPLLFAGDISGFWKHRDAPAWIEISLDEGKGTVVRNDKFPERVGRKILKDLEADDAEENLWRGQVYVEMSGEFRKVEVTLPEPGRMEFKVRVGFRSRTIEWVRVDEVPSTSPE